MYPVIDTTALFKHLTEGAFIITPNNRLAVELLREAAGQGFEFFEKPRCLPFTRLIRDAFLTYTHAHAHTTCPILLSPCQLRHLWQRVLQEAGVRGVELLAPLASEAFDRLQAWQLDPQDMDVDATPQTTRFNDWQRQFHKALERLDALCESLLPAFLLERHALHGAGETFIWACFDEFTPIQQTLQNALAADGARHLVFERQSLTPVGARFEAADNTEEHQALTEWLHRHLAAGSTRIGLVIPDLQTRAGSVRRQLAATFAAQDFNLSLAEPLAQHPLTTHALAILLLERETLSRHEAITLLTSPWIAGSQREYWARAAFAEQSTLLQEHRFAGIAFCNALEPKAPLLAGLIANLTPYPTDATPMEWTRLFLARLEAFGFPGDTSMDSHTWQYFQRLNTLFEEFQSLGFISPLMRREQALQTLRHLCTTTPFEPRQEKAAPIQVLGLLEASGCRFDHLWITGMTSQALPASASPSPFLPIRLQQAREMPHASPERELRFAHQLIERLRASADSCVFSLPTLSDAVPNQPSPLITHLPAYVPAFLAPEVPVLETVSESWCLPLLSDEAPTGGTRLLGNQAQCPFKAFAAHRLHLQDAHAPTDGPSRMERGILLHAILEHLWKALRTQERLFTLPEATLQRFVDEAIDHALKALQWRAHSFSPLMQDVERERLRHLVQLALEQERERPPFVVEALEEVHTLIIGGLPLECRVDRIDRLENGDKWVIDYKSSLPAPPWYDERPQEPQLLLYALLEDAIRCVLFWGMGRGESALQGLIEGESPLKGVIPPKGQSFAELRRQWQERLETLAQEFLQGHCPPAPLKAETCKHCAFDGLCRFGR